MQDRPSGTMVRCSKARAMFAMRACTRSVTIGRALAKTGMTAIIRHMGTMDQGWRRRDPCGRAMLCLPCYANVYLR